MPSDYLSSLPVRTRPTVELNVKTLAGTQLHVKQGDAAPITSAWPVKITDGTDTANITASGNISVNIAEDTLAGLKIQGLGTAGTPAGGVLTVQGVSGMRPIDVNVVTTTPFERVHKYGTITDLAVNTPTIVVDYDVPAGKKFNLTDVIVSADDFTKFVVKDSDQGTPPTINVLAVFYTNPSNMTVSYQFDTEIEILAGHKIYVEATTIDNATDVHVTFTGYNTA